MIKERPANSRFAKAEVSCFNENEVINSSFVHLMKFSAENPAFTKRQTVVCYFKKERTKIKPFNENNI